MNLPRSLSLRAVGLGLVCVVMAGCSPEPAPTPTPTPAFASEEEAFAAAEETYRAYNEAGNATGDGLDFLTGSALEDELTTTRYLQDNDLTLQGASEIKSFMGREAVIEPNNVLIEVRVCVDVSKVFVVSASGDDVTPTDRIDVLVLDVTFISTGAELLITQSETAEDAAC